MVATYMLKRARIGYLDKGFEQILQQKGFFKMYNIFSIAVSIYGQLPYTFGGHGSVFNFFGFNSKSGSLIQFTTKGYEP